MVKEFWRKAASHVVPLLMIEWSLLLLIPQQRLPMIFIELDNPRNCPLPRGSRPNVIVQFLGLTRVCPPIGISIGSAVFAGLTNMINRHTHTQRQTNGPRYSGCSNRPHLVIAAMRPKVVFSRRRYIAVDGDMSPSTAIYRRSENAT